MEPSKCVVKYCEKKAIYDATAWADDGEHESEVIAPLCDEHLSFFKNIDSARDDYYDIVFEMTGLQYFIF